MVHHLELSRSTRVLWALEELGLPYTVKTYQRHPKTFRAGPEVKAVHPLGRFPVVTVGDAVLAESAAILEELSEGWAGGTLMPTDPEGRRQHRYWMHFAEGSLMPPLLVALITGKLRRTPIPLRWIAGAVGQQVDAAYTDPQLDDLITFVDAHLQRQRWFAGDAFSLADIQMSYPVLAALQRARGPDRPGMRAWAAQIQQRPAWKKAVELGGPPLPDAL